MNFIEKKLVKIGKKIADREQKKLDAIQKTNDAIKQSKLDATKLIQNHIWKTIRDVEVKMLENPCHFNVGDTVILNKYELQYRSDDCWDWGSRQLLQNVDKKKTSKPILVKITKIDVHVGYVDERIENFIDRFEDRNQTTLEIASQNLDMTFRKFLEYIKSLNHKWINEYGLYKEAYFEPINSKFKPRWALNINSFLSLESEAGQVTERLWKEEGELYWKWLQAKNDYDQFKVKRDGEIFAYKLIYK